MAFLWTTLHVSDISRSLNFYQTAVGLEVASQFQRPGKHFVFLNKDGTQLELIQDNEFPAITPGNNLSLGFSIADADVKMAELTAAGIPVHSGPFSPGPMIRFFYVLDPDGHKIQFVEQKNA